MCHKHKMMISKERTTGIYTLKLNNVALTVCNVNHTIYTDYNCQIYSLHKNNIYKDIKNI